MHNIIIISVLFVFVIGYLYRMHRSINPVNLSKYSESEISNGIVIYSNWVEKSVIRSAPFGVSILKLQPVQIESLNNLLDIKFAIAISNKTSYTLSGCGCGDDISLTMKLR